MKLVSSLTTFTAIAVATLAWKMMMGRMPPAPATK